MIVCVCVYYVCVIQPTGCQKSNKLMLCYITPNLLEENKTAYWESVYEVVYAPKTGTAPWLIYWYCTSLTKFMKITLTFWGPWSYHHILNSSQNKQIFVRLKLATACVNLQVDECALCLKKRGVKLFAITSSTVNQFWNSFTVGNSNGLSIK